MQQALTLSLVGPPARDPRREPKSAGESGEVGFDAIFVETEASSGSGESGKANSGDRPSRSVTPCESCAAEQVRRPGKSGLVSMDVGFIVGSGEGSPEHLSDARSDETVLSGSGIPGSASELPSTRSGPTKCEIEGTTGLELYLSTSKENYPLVPELSAVQGGGATPPVGVRAGQSDLPVISESGPPDLVQTDDYDGDGMPPKDPIAARDISARGADEAVETGEIPFADRAVHPVRLVDSESVGSETVIPTSSTPQTSITGDSWKALQTVSQAPNQSGVQVNGDLAEDRPLNPATPSAVERRSSVEGTLAGRYPTPNESKSLLGEDAHLVGQRAPIDASRTHSRDVINNVDGASPDRSSEIVPTTPRLPEDKVAQKLAVLPEGSGGARAKAPPTPGSEPAFGRVEPSVLAVGAAKDDLKMVADSASAISVAAARDVSPSVGDQGLRPADVPSTVSPPPPQHAGAGKSPNGEEEVPRPRIVAQGAFPEGGELASGDKGKGADLFARVFPDGTPLESRTQVRVPREGSAGRGYAAATRDIAPATTATARVAEVPRVALGALGEGRHWDDVTEGLSEGDAPVDATRSQIQVPHAARNSGAPMPFQARSVFQPVASVIAERLATGPAGSVDLRLSPEELGNLKISFVSSDTGLNVVIQADRPETLELFRRNIVLFSEDLRALGYEDVTMSFGREGPDSYGPPSGGEMTAPEEVDDASGPAPAISQAPLPAAATCGLDLRF